MFRYFVVLCAYLWGWPLLGAQAAPKQPIYALSYESLEGKPVRMSQYRGKVLLVVNTASRCGYTPQYEGLEALYKKYKKDGLVVLGFPSNDFGAQEPGSAEEIAAFCQRNYGVTFPMAAKIKVLGDSKHPIYAYLTQVTQPQKEVSWNFEKFLIDKQGVVQHRFSSATKPQAKELEEALQKMI
ncbi:MAG: glutathione peroxidase [Zetaproteobacteria bacterium]|nr:glutathione peroxidase [Zetaproteobacteria bacterium]